MDLKLVGPLFFMDYDHWYEVPLEDSYKWYFLAVEAEANFHLHWQ